VKIVSCSFTAAACRAEHEPPAKGPEVVFLGRSNVGKSSLINRLLGVRGLARTSSSPGRTQSVNFYRVNDAFGFVDLPGYGYAAVPEAVRRSWRPMVDDFLERHRERIAIAVLVLDARHPPTELDGVMREWLVARGIPFVVAATKVDKLSASARAHARHELAAFGAAGGAPGVFVSAQTGTGIGAVWRELERTLGGPRGRRRA